jgi:hypothetical protein
LEKINCCKIKRDHHVNSNQKQGLQQFGAINSAIGARVKLAKGGFSKKVSWNYGVSVEGTGDAGDNN